MFETEQHEQLRFAVVDLFKRYKKNREELQKTWGQQDSLSEEELNKLAKNVASLEASKYLLAVIGESKSGKSAFINGLIKKPLLPTGILQCTSGIIEIVDTNNENNKQGKVYCPSTLVQNYPL
jgi:ribosome biogenesis GTPase A